MSNWRRPVKKRWNLLRMSMRFTVKVVIVWGRILRLISQCDTCLSYKNNKSFLKSSSYGNFAKWLECLYFGLTIKRPSFPWEPVHRLSILVISADEPVCLVDCLTDQPGYNSYVTDYIERNFLCVVDILFLPCFFFSFFLMRLFWLVLHKSFLWGHWYPCFGFLVTSALGFKARMYP